MEKMSKKITAVLIFMLIIGLGAAVHTHPASASDGLPRILVLATGGTIAGKASGTSAIGYTSGQLTGKDLIAAVPGVEKLAELSTDQVSNIGSQDMNDEVWLKLYNRIKQAFANDEADGIVITHGTDTLEETAFFLEQVLPSDKPVVLVGSMRPSTALSADGPANLYAAVKVATHPDSKGRGVLVVLNDIIHETRDVTKTDTSAVQTFESPNAGPVGYVDPAAVRFLHAARAYPRPRFRAPTKVPMPRVDIIYSHSNMTADLTNASIRGAPVVSCLPASATATPQKLCLKSWLKQPKRVSLLSARHAWAGDSPNAMPRSTMTKWALPPLSTSTPKKRAFCSS